MPNVRRMWQFFELIDDRIQRMSSGDERLKALLNEFVISLFTICDGLEGPDGWSGISLVYTDDLPETVEEINDGFLHEMWSDRKRG